MSDGPRKYLPAEGYRFLTLAFLAERGPTGATKGEITWETRANHYMATRVLRGLADERLVAMHGDAEHGFTIHITAEGHTFLAQHRDYALRTHGRILRAHYQYGRRPQWIDALLA